LRKDNPRVSNAWRAFGANDRIVDFLFTPDDAKANSLACVSVEAVQLRKLLPKLIKESVDQDFFAGALDYGVAIN
jgi:hypothetical protein